MICFFSIAAIFILKLTLIQMMIGQNNGRTFYWLIYNHFRSFEVLALFVSAEVEFKVVMGSVQYMMNSSFN